MGTKKALRPTKSVFAVAKKKKAREALQQNRLDEARMLLEESCRMAPRDFEAWFLLGATHGQLEDHHQAAACLLRAIRLEPDSVPALRNLAHALQRLGEWDELVDCQESLAQLDPANLDNLASLASMRQFIRLELQAAVDGYQEILRRRPGSPVILDNLANAYTAQGRFVEALAIYAELLARQPGERKFHSNLLLTLHYDPSQTAETLFQAHLRWGERHDRARSPARVFPNAPDPTRRLRVGYVSADFRVHPVTSFLSPILASHNRDGFEVFCYSAVPSPDAGTVKLRALADQWREIAAMDDQAAAALVRKDEVDILVDLAGHTGGNRLGLFLEMPAPVQVTYLGYPDTTGLPGMDYRITDMVADPPGQEQFYTEQLLRLPGCFLCYTAPEFYPEPGPLPASANGHITFGSLNNLAKINEKVVALWAELLLAVEGSCLLVKNPSLTDLPTRALVLAAFMRNGIAPERLDLLGFVPEAAGHLAVYNRIDIALDTFPYNGTTTTFEALWMGVPVVSLSDVVHASRVGRSLLTALGFPEWVARTPVEYRDVVVQLCRDHERLAGWRATLRSRMLASTLMDTGSFVRGLEEAYREIWKRWCVETIGKGERP